ncbi:MAG: hypothetical protein QXN55_00035 [Candidatus Nitrosotenuis sp.]
MANTITIATDEYERLQEAEKKLSALEAAGVDNWEGYDYAMEILEDMEYE